MRTRQCYVLVQLAREQGDFLLVGLHTDDDVMERRGAHLPIMDLHERSLSVLACRYVNEVIIGEQLPPTAIAAAPAASGASRTAAQMTATVCGVQVSASACVAGGLLETTQAGRTVLLPGWLLLTQGAGSCPQRVSCQNL